MCYDISFTVNINELSDYFPGVVFEGQLEINFDAAIHIIGHNYGLHPILYRNREDGRVHMREMEWGVIPFYVREENKFLRQRATMLNARRERILDDEKSYWYKIRNRRCLIPVTGIYEHRGIRGWKKKVPYFVQLARQPLFFLPGLYSVTELPDLETGELIKRWTFTLITTEANSLMRQIHNDGENRGRMPLFLPLELAQEFLSDELSTDRYREILDYQMPPEEMTYLTVCTIRSPKARPDGKRKNEYFEWEKLPELGMANPD